MSTTEKIETWPGATSKKIIVDWMNAAEPADNDRSQARYALRPEVSPAADVAELRAWLEWNDANGDYDDATRAECFCLLGDMLVEDALHRADTLIREQRAEEIAEQVKKEILSDIAEGTTPPDIRSWADLHDHRDANTYGNLDVRIFDATTKEEEEEELKTARKIINIIERWLPTL